MESVPKIKFEISKREWDELDFDEQMKLQDLMEDYYGVDVKDLIEKANKNISSEIDPYLYLDKVVVLDCGCCGCEFCGCTCDIDDEEYGYLYPREDE